MQIRFGRTLRMYSSLGGPLVAVPGKKRSQGNHAVQERPQGFRIKIAIEPIIADVSDAVLRDAEQGVTLKMPEFRD